LLPSIELINAVTDIKVTIKDVKHGRRIAGFKFNISKQSKSAAKTTPKQIIDKTQPTTTH